MNSYYIGGGMFTEGGIEFEGSRDQLIEVIESLTITERRLRRENEELFLKYRTAQDMSTDFRGISCVGSIDGGVTMCVEHHDCPAFSVVATSGSVRLHSMTNGGCQVKKKLIG